MILELNVDHWKRLAEVAKECASDKKGSVKEDMLTLAECAEKIAQAMQIMKSVTTRCRCEACLSETMH